VRRLVRVDFHQNFSHPVGLVEEELADVLDSESGLESGFVGFLEVDCPVGEVVAGSGVSESVEGFVVEELVAVENILSDGLAGFHEDRRGSVGPAIIRSEGGVDVDIVGEGCGYFTEHSRVAISKAFPHKSPIIGILALEEQPLFFFPPHDLSHLINEGEIIELARNKWQCSIDGIILGGNVIDGCISDEDGDDQADDGCHDLAAVCAGLSFLQMKVFDEEGADLVLLFFGGGF
jgi:hypothetical protein